MTSQKRQPAETLQERMERRRRALEHNARFIRFSLRYGPLILLGAFGLFMLVHPLCEPGGFGNILIGLVTVIPSGVAAMCILHAIRSTPERPHPLAVRHGYMAHVEDAPDLPDIHGTARWADTKELEERGMLLDASDTRERGKRIILGTDVTGKLLTHVRATGIITVGAPGTGKFLTAIALNLFNWILGSVWVFDPKGEITVVTAWFRSKFSKVIVINPFGVLYTTPEEKARYPFMRPARFNPLDALLEAKDFDDVAATIAARLVVGAEGKDDFWLQGARSLMAGIIAYLFHAATAVDAMGRPFPRTLAGIAAFLQQPPDALTAHARIAMQDMRDCMYLARDGMVEWASACGAPPPRDGAEPSGKAREWPKSTLETLFTLRRQLSELLRSSGIRETLSGSDFKWSDLRRRKVSVYIVLPADKVERFERFTTLLLDDALETLAAPPKPNDLPVYMVLDEVATALHKRMRWIGRAYGLSRGQRFIIHAFFQNWSQVRSAFPNPGEITGAAGTLQFFRNQDPETIEALRHFGGRYTEWLHMVTESWGTQVNQSAFGNQQAARTSEGGGAGWQHHAQDLITAELVREGLGTPEEANGFMAKQIVISEGLAAPVLAGRGAYFHFNPAWAQYHNPYAPVGPYNPPPPDLAHEPEPAIRQGQKKRA